MPTIITVSVIVGAVAAVTASAGARLCLSAVVARGYKSADDRSRG